MPTSVLRAGGRGYIGKQEGGDKLIEAIRRVLGGEIVVSEKMTGRLVEKFSGRKTMDSPLEGLSDRELEVFSAHRPGQNDERNWRRVTSQPEDDRNASIPYP